MALTRRKASEPVSDLMKKLEAAKYLKVSYQVLTRMMKNDGLPYRQSGRTYLFSRKALDEWAASGNGFGSAEK